MAWDFFSLLPAFSAPLAWTKFAPVRERFWELGVSGTYEVPFPVSNPVPIDFSKRQ
jgi:hypothetical protein